MSRGSQLYQPASVGLFGESGIDYKAALASYSADSIGMGGTVRRPLRMDGAEWVCVGSMGKGYSPYVCSSISIYKLVAASEFDGEAVTYNERQRVDRETWPSEGFYHGMKVKSGGRALVLVGPEYELLAEPLVIHRGADADEDEGADESEDFELTGEDDPDDYGARPDDWEDEDTQESLFELPMLGGSAADRGHVATDSKQGLLF